jgi:multisubunit Na+/H+ antiporter MnhF subunit
MLIVTLVLISIHYNLTVYLDIAIAFLLLDFVGIIAFTKYLGQEKTR